MFLYSFIVLLIRQLKTNLKSLNSQQQRCKVCGNIDKFDFHVSDDVWSSIVPKKYQNHVVCLSCFDDFSKKNNINYAESIDKLYFAGNCSFIFEKVFGDISVEKNN